MSPSLSNLYAAAEAPLRDLPMSPYAFGGLAFIGFLSLLAILWGFRGTAQKLASPVHHGEHGDHGAPQGGHH